MRAEGRVVASVFHPASRLGANLAGAEAEGRRCVRTRKRRARRRRLAMEVGRRVERLRARHRFRCGRRSLWCRCSRPVRAEARRSRCCRRSHPDGDERHHQVQRRWNRRGS